MNIITTISIVILTVSLCGLSFSESELFRNLMTVTGILSILLLIFSLTGKTGSRTDKKSTTSEQSKDIIHQELIDELNQLFELLESAVKEDLVVVKQELYQIKSLVNNAVSQLSESFHNVSSNSSEQQRLIKIALDALSSGKDENTLSQLDKTQKKIQDSSAIAVQSLQFEDIVTQVSDNSIQYIDNLDDFFREFRMRMNDQLNNDSDYNDTVDLLKHFLEDVKQLRKTRLLPDRKAANQNNLSEGDVELF